MVDKSPPSPNLHLVRSEPDRIFSFTRSNEFPNYRLRRLVAGFAAGALLVGAFAGLEHVVSRFNTRSEAMTLLELEQRGDVSLVLGKLNKGGDFDSALDEVFNDLPPEIRDRFAPLRPSVAEALDQHGSVTENQDGPRDEFIPVGYIVNDLGQYQQ